MDDGSGCKEATDGDGEDERDGEGEAGGYMGVHLGMEDSREQSC